MDLARVYVGPLNTESMLVPSSWDRWEYQGHAFRRRGDQVQQWCWAAWELAKVEATRLDVRYSK